MTHSISFLGIAIILSSSLFLVNCFRFFQVVDKKFVALNGAASSIKVPSTTKFALDSYGFSFWYKTKASRL